MNLSSDEIIRAIHESENLDIRDAPFRYLPKCVLETSKNNFIVNGDSMRILDYILNSFYIYRETVNKGFFAPHVLVDSAYEWPQNNYFEWSDIDEVLLLGKKLSNPNNSNSIIRIETLENNKLYSRNIIKGVDGIVSKVVSRDIDPYLDKMNALFKYKINNLSEINLLFSDDWQNYSLKKYVAPVKLTLQRFENNLISREAIDDGFLDYLSILDDYIPNS